MRTITKSKEPRSLTEYRKEPGATYADYRHKQELRQAFVGEQRGLCCYCMGRIEPRHGSMRIEHWRSQRWYPDEELSYENLLGACSGGEKLPRGEQHCDARKGDRELKWSPADPTRQIEKRVRYGTDGAIGSNDAEFDNQLSEVLNLNLTRLKNNRKGVLDEVLRWWKREKARIRGPVPRATLLKQRNKRVAGRGHLTPYSQVAVWWIDQKVARMPA